MHRLFLLHAAPSPNSQLLDLNIFMVGGEEEERGLIKPGVFTSSTASLSRRATQSIQLDSTEMDWKLGR